jgi:hypothetical protein
VRAAKRLDGAVCVPCCMSPTIEADSLGFVACDGNRGRLPRPPPH